GGRALRPVTHLPGGFTSIPNPEEFGGILEQLKSIRADAEEVVCDVAVIRPTVSMQMVDNLDARRGPRTSSAGSRTPSTPCTRSQRFPPSR
ncbi:MAG: hypothetical protein MUC88_24165, partial [Planctomycetes bacterium]|nr:hypothetical protein [Planctomycetota bacterium]